MRVDFNKDNVGVRSTDNDNEIVAISEEERREWLDRRDVILMENLKNYQDIVRKGNVFTVCFKDETTLNVKTVYFDEFDELYVSKILDDKGVVLVEDTQIKLFSLYEDIFLDIFLTMIREKLYQIRRK